VASGLQTHARPESSEAEERLARALGFDGADAFGADIGRHMKRVSARFLSLLPEPDASVKEGAEAPRRGRAKSPSRPELPASRFSHGIAALERADPEGFAEAVIRVATGGAATAPESEPN